MTMTKKPPVKKAADKAPKKSKPDVDEKIQQVAKDVAATSPIPPDDAQERYRACSADITAVLRTHRCRIVAVLNQPEVVGSEPITKMMISASWGIVSET